MCVLYIYIYMYIYIYIVFLCICIYHCMRRRMRRQTSTAATSEPICLLATVSCAVFAYKATHAYIFLHGTLQYAYQSLHSITTCVSPSPSRLVFSCIPTCVSPSPSRFVMHPTLCYHVLIYSLLPSIHHASFAFHSSACVRIRKLPLIPIYCY